MQILAEIHPKSTMEKTVRFISTISNFDGFNFPDGPMGLPAVHPLSLAPLVRTVASDKRIIVNQRVSDVGELFLASLALSARFWRLDVVLTRGDLPKLGKRFSSLTSEEGLKTMKAVEPKVSVGLLLSLRYPRNEVQRRMNISSDFFLVLRARSPADLVDLDKSKLIPYLIIKTARNAESLEAVGQPFISMDEVPDVLDSMKHAGVQGVLLSTAGIIKEWKS
ncbi:hypothetical protein HS1genome_0787 [Sulfodiicoccus acidiphilus]|uniref:Methylenetetrahydrofolate reductase (NAD(P)H) n=1 Tax=Sulfodiicoccus acidiphilus TaxID=1670455 RepID=A0A348B2J6_9CREN|nr:hypothetical protein [Sulfodiicoccus acidiphilus]BBD72398.1 hypothetical protein HS1genome_0787 [Sulfodiicoccus acidiphilus]